MKLAEALLLRSEMQTKLAKLRQRIAKAAVVQEGDTPQEDAEQLLKEASGVNDDLYALVERIHRTNQREKLGDGRTIAQAMAERDRLRQELALLTFAAESASANPEDGRYSMREIKWVPALNVSKLHKQADDVSSKVRELNAKLQETNWRASLAD